MAAYNNFVETIFKSANLDVGVQHQLIADFCVAAGAPALLPGNTWTYSLNLLSRAHQNNYQVVTRFVPPYCTTVTFYKDVVGFVTVSRLAPTFNSSLTNLPGGLVVTTSAVETLQQAYNHITQLNRARSNPPTASNPRDQAAHESAAHNALIIDSQKFRSDIRHEWVSAATFNYQISTAATREYAGTFGNKPQSKAKLYFLRPISYGIGIACHWMFVSSHVSFEKGPAAVMNDILYSTHNGKYAKNLHIINGELSAHLNALGMAVAFLNLNWVTAIISAILALAVAAWVDNKTGKIIAGAVLFGLLCLQALWTLFISSTTYENIVTNDIRMRTMRQAAALFGLNYREAKLLLTMVSSWREINAHGDSNSYADIAGMGAVELSDAEPSDIIYISGYITSSLNPQEIDDPLSPNESRAPLAAWVPYDTHRITYSSNDVIRRFSLIDNALHLSNSRRSTIKRVAGTLVYTHDTDQNRLPRKLRLYSELPGHRYWII